jgi:hypothetical protein
MDLKTFHKEWEIMSEDEKSFTRKRLDSQRLQSATALRNLHQQILPIEAELQRLSDQYEKEHKNYQAIDRKLSVADGRHELCKPVKGMAHKPKPEKTLDQLIIGMSPDQLQEFILKHAKKGE